MQRPEHSSEGNNDLQITEREMSDLFLLKHGSPATAGWAPRRRFAFGYHQPADYYEALVSKLVTSNTNWLDVGGGEELFRFSDAHAQLLADRAQRLVGVDPSDNIEKNKFVHEHAMCMIEDYETDVPFDLATLRMVAEHIDNPHSVVRSLNRLLTLGGRVVVYTVNRWSPVTLISHAVPFRFHHPIKKLFWGSKEQDTFPTVYKMNTRVS